MTAVGGTQLQYHWTWNPSSDVPFTAAGDFNPAYFAAGRDASNRNVVWNESWLPSATGGGSSVLYTTDVAPTHQGAAGVVSGDLVNNRLFDYDGDGNPVTPGPVPGWPTTTGWDETTGFGTPDAPAFVSALTTAP